MKKKLLVKELSDYNNMSQSEARTLLDQLLAELTELLSRGESYHEQDFGTFKSVYSKPATGFHPVLKKKMHLPQKKKIRFVPSSNLKKLINE